MSLGSSFHSLGLAYLNERSPNVIRLLKEGLFSKSVSSEFLRLYLEAGFSSTSSDIYRRSDTVEGFVYKEKNFKLDSIVNG